MSDCLLELMSEEMPASLLEKSANSVHQQIVNNLLKNSLTIKKSEYFYSPKRLLFIFYRICPKEKKILIKGPNINAPSKAIQGFANSHNFATKDLIKKKTDKGEYFFIEKTITDYDVQLTLKNIIESSLNNFPWKKSMRWGSNQLRWIRPLKNILCIFNNKKLDFKIGHLSSNDFTLHSNPLVEKKIKIKSIKNYFEQLKKNKIEINQETRKKLILNDGNKLAKKKNLKLSFEEDLLDEVRNLVEYPYLFLAKFDSKYLDLPNEILITSMKKHQKYFPLYYKNKLSNYFLLVSNLEPNDDGKSIIEGNQRVINARLEDASFFWKKDKNENFENKNKKLERIIFHNKLGSLNDKIFRLTRLSSYLKVDLNLSENHYKNLNKAIELSKNDLVSEVVKEFPSLQGRMGYYYSLNAGFNNIICEAIKDHYKPIGPNDECPNTNTSKILALLDKMDTVTGFFLINEAPSSSKDPFALRRAGLGVLRIIVEGKFSINLSNLISKAIEGYLSNKSLSLKIDKSDIKLKIINFILERYENLIKDNHTVDPLMYASIALDNNNINIIDINRRCKILENFINKKKGLSFLVAYKRILNILNEAQEMNASKGFDYINQDLLNSKEEKKLYMDFTKYLGKNNFGKFQNLESLASLTSSINDFFDYVKINDSNRHLKNNRLFLLSLIKNKINLLADFSKIIKGKEL